MLVAFKVCIAIKQKRIKSAFILGIYKSTSEDVLHQLETKENIIEEVFKGHENLLGILLGFGLHNSQVYQKREELDQSAKGRPPFDFEKIKALYKINLTRFPPDKDDNPLLNFILLPQYVEDKHHPESIRLRQKYRNIQKVLCDIYSQGNFLEITLDALTKKQNE